MFGVGCPGSSALKTPELKIRRCPECGSEVEVFSTDIKVRCLKCGFTVYNDLQSCIDWCNYAEKCVGPELVKRLRSGKAGQAGGSGGPGVPPAGPRGGGQKEAGKGGAAEGDDGKGAGAGRRTKKSAR